VNLSISDRRLFNVAISISDSACPSIQNPQSEIDNPQSKVGAAHEIPAFTDQLALARFQDAAALRAILSIADFGLRVPDCDPRFRIRNGKEVFAGSGLLLNFERFVRDVHQPSAFPIRIMARGKSVSEPPPAGFALVFASSAQCPASASRKTAAPAEAGTVRYSGLG